MATPTYNKKRGLWILQAQNNGIKKTFYSSKPGQPGKRDVLRMYDDWLAFGGVDRRVTVEKCVELYLEDIENRLGRRDTFREAEIYTRLYVLPALGRCKMYNLTIRDWQAVINNARPQKDPSQSLSHKTLTHLRAVIVGLHKFAYNNYFCDEWRGALYIPQGHKKGVREILQPADISRMFEPSDYWYAPAFQIMLLCGLRPGECLGLQEKDIKNGVLYISRAINDAGQITEGKNKNARRAIPLPSLAADIIAATIARNRAAKFGTPWIFPNGCGAPAAQYAVRKEWAKLKAERNLPGTLYSLRHTFISIVSSQTHLAEGTIRELVGHSQSMDTFGTYKHAVAGDLENAASVINLTFERLKAQNE